MYRPADRMLWDFWTQQRDGVTHLFHLQAPRDLADPELRHGLAQVGGAVSRDLVHWDDLGVVFAPGPAGSWDDRAIWTGSVMALRNGTYAMLYTGTATAEAGKVQRVGLARSRDLVHWQRHPGNPVIEADPRWYLGANPASHGETAWRDPWLAHDPAAPRGSDGYVAYITAQTHDAPADRSGCIALARSPDLVHWTVGPPVAAPRTSFQMEVPQLWTDGRRAYLLFSAWRRWIPDDVGVPAVDGTFYMVAEHPDGDFRFGGLLCGDHGDGTALPYAARIVDGPDGPRVLAWLGYDGAGDFAGALDDPRPLHVAADGQVSC